MRFRPSFACLFTECLPCRWPAPHDTTRGSQGQGKRAGRCRCPVRPGSPTRPGEPADWPSLELTRVPGLPGVTRTAAVPPVAPPTPSPTSGSPSGQGAVRTPLQLDWVVWATWGHSPGGPSLGGDDSGVRIISTTLYDSEPAPLKSREAVKSGDFSGPP